MIKRVGVKFCGNCNPHINTAFLLEQLKNSSRDMKFVCWEKNKYDILLLLNSCPVGCATRPEFDGPLVIVTSDSVNYLPVSFEKIVNEILKALRQKF
ncbi:hypothetical protein D4Z93_08280 [Clostridium fermenticellae]|uniref:Uncharacterized protein n=1 Tax=Clostridium fermenticellae TaxID=2068654 RepID=A0A386H4R6_9CLOT|nr:hypothetical protein [Clostridium fermenticellae]AYD40523.1 hypothetical protein D4Z93_08280 [Clostridium fermenticellae]